MFTEGYFVGLKLATEFHRHPPPMKVGTDNGQI